MRVGIILPTRSDRPSFVRHALFLINQQTIQPTQVALMDYEPESKEKDISQRYRNGYDKLRGKNLDCIFLWEDDDYYSHIYTETQLAAWVSHGRPDLFGTNYTNYYHLKERAYFTMYHDTRSSAMSTLIKPDLNFEWCPDNEPYTDTHLWMASGLKGVTYQPPGIICIGIKHGVGLTGGSFHNDRMQTYKGDRATNDREGNWLRTNTDPKSFEFYRNYFKDQIPTF